MLLILRCPRRETLALPFNDAAPPESRGCAQEEEETVF